MSSLSTVRVDHGWDTFVPGTSKAKWNHLGTFPLSTLIVA